MNRTEIQTALTDAHEQLIDHANSLSSGQFEFRKNGSKWNAGQEVLHIIKSVKALNKALSMPKLALKVTFGTSNRPTRSQEEVVNKYQSILKERNIVTTPSFEPEPITAADRELLIGKLRQKVKELNRKLEGFSEKDLDKYVIPHPLLGKMPMREMCYFTIYHVGHHLSNSQRNLEAYS